MLYLATDQQARLTLSLRNEERASCRPDKSRLVRSSGSARTLEFWQGPGGCDTGSAADF